MELTRTGYAVHAPERLQEQVHEHDRAKQSIECDARVFANDYAVVSKMFLAIVVSYERSSGAVSP